MCSRLEFLCVVDFDRINSNSPPNRQTHRVNPFLKDMPKSSNNIKHMETMSTYTESQQQPKSQNRNELTTPLPSKIINNSLSIENKQDQQQRDEIENINNQIEESRTQHLKNDLNDESQITEIENANDQTTKKNIVNNNETNSNNVYISSNSDNQNGNELIEEGSGTVKTTLPPGKVVRRKKSPPQQGGSGNGNGNGNDIISSSITNTTTINNNNNRSNAMHRASLAKMEGLLTNSNDHLNVASMSTSMEIEGKFISSRSNLANINPSQQYACSS